MIAPEKLLIRSDDNEMKLVRIQKTKTEILYEYEYTKSPIPLSNIIFTEKWLQKYLKDQIFLEIK